MEHTQQHQVMKTNQQQNLQLRKPCNMNPLVKKSLENSKPNLQLTIPTFGISSNIVSRKLWTNSFPSNIILFSLPCINKLKTKNYKQKQRLYNKAKTFKIQADCTLFMKFCKATQKKIQSQYWKYRAHIIILKQDKEQMIWHNINDKINQWRKQ